MTSIAERLPFLQPAACALALTAFIVLSYPADARADMPNRRLTPGDAAQHDRATVCALGNARRHRAVSYRTRDRVYLAYGIPRGRRKGRYRIDHLVPLELGGSNRPQNLWPQPIADAARKDRVEEQLHGLVCNGKLSLGEAQRAIRLDWRTAVPAQSLAR